jgi:hypothetical protein
MALASGNPIMMGNAVSSFRSTRTTIELPPVGFKSTPFTVTSKSAFPSDADGAPGFIRETELKTIHRKMIHFFMIPIALLFSHDKSHRLLRDGFFKIVDLTIRSHFEDGPLVSYG